MLELMGVREKASDAWEITKLAVGALIVIAIAIWGVQAFLSSLGDEQPNADTASAILRDDVFYSDQQCYGSLPGIDGPAPPCIVPIYVLAIQGNDGTWCPAIKFLYQREDEVAAAAATRPFDFVYEVVWDVPYYEGVLPGDFCGEIRTSSFNGRNNPDDPDAWTFLGPVNEIREQLEAATGV